MKDFNFKMPDDIFAFDSDDKSDKKKKKKKKHKKIKVNSDFRYVYMYSQVITAILASSMNEDFIIPRYTMKDGQYSIIETAGSIKVHKVKHIQFSINEASLNTLLNSNFVKKRIRVQNTECYSGIDYTVIRVSVPNFIEIWNHAVSLSSEKGNEISKIMNNLSGIHDAQLIGKKKKLIGTIIRG